ncbi:inositol 2-dehydrogenase [Ktedonosporobacter rubrisoli]|uniref:Inositol 2-dehydrogenase n=1 Tax=Ktedonosporobacter rubrisoli TaxID=2509675 RepID=A0A4P6JU03_KTERU|nr:inositol 2-dehydrogenase [Ktedonosporobacter rubrisoli]QBD78803.1 inositol 2-dehydrogenase [Ktedonosporobacter rubrisoli]
MAEKINCAVLGLGRLGWLHAANLAERVAGVNLLAVADVVAERAADFAAQYAVPLHTADIDAVIEHPDVEAVVIVTPTTTHAALIQKAIAARKAIFVEKPITLSLDEARTIDQLVQQANAYCQVGFMRRYDPAYYAAAEKIRRGDIGKPLYFKAVSRDPQCPPEAYIRDSGRLFLDMSIHDFDIARFLMADEVVEVTAMGAVVKNAFLQTYADVDQALTFVRFANGATGDIEGSRNAGYGYDIRAEVVGTEGTIQVGALSQHALHIFNKRGATHDIFPGFIERFASAYVLELEDFIARLQRGDASPVTTDDGYKAVAIALAATRSFDEQRAVKLDYQPV